MKSYREERAKELRRRKFLGVVFLIALVFAFGTQTIFELLKKVSHIIAEPLWQTSSLASAGASEIHAVTRSEEELIVENEQLRKQLLDLDLSLKTLDVLRRENAELRSLGGRNGAEVKLLARVLVRPPRTAYDALVVDRGSLDGVTIGMRAVIAGGFFLGKVTSVAPRTSTVTLASTAGVSYDGMLTGVSGRVTAVAPEFTDKELMSTTSLDVLSSASDEAGVASSSSSVASTSESDIRTIIHSTSTIKTASGMRTQVSFVGLGGGGFRALVPKQMQVTKDEPISLLSPELSFLGVVTGVFVPPNGSLKEVYGSLPVGVSQIEWVSLIPALDTELSSSTVTAR